jgi:ectoine hydroxylase-related dioxygenase (phytanoyl-CoA dioxygenase family)
MSLDVKPLAATGYERISDADRRQYAEQGWLLIRNALEEPMLQRVTDAVDRVYAEESAAGRVKPDGAAHVMGCMARDSAFTDLVDHPTMFPYVWGLMGWNIYTHHNHIDVNPPVTDAGAPFWNWHQDGYRQNADVDMDPRPMLSAKICYVLSDLSEPGRGSTRIIPGSHVDNTLAGRPTRPELGFDEPEGAIQVLANPGDAFIFDRRLWHSRSVNLSAVTRKLVFVGYTYRWIRPLDEVSYDQTGEFWEELSPVQRQLLGGGDDNANFWGIEQNGWIDDTIPLRSELMSRGLLDRNVPYLR